MSQLIQSKYSAFQECQPLWLKKTSYEHGFQPPNKSEMTIWNSSIYRLYQSDNRSQNKFKEIFLDVTDSAPPFPKTGDALASALDELVQKFSSKHEINILDFGAGRLRNTIYLLRRSNKNNVSAVEFESLTNASKSHYKEAKKFQTRFTELIYPHQFFESPSKFNIVIFINVLNIMPIRAERLLAINYCKEKLAEGGFILSYTQHNDRYYTEHCTKDNRLGDGYYLNETDTYKTFYKDFDPNEVDEMFLSCGMKFEGKISRPNVVARFYSKRCNNPLEQVLDAHKIRRYVEGDVAYEKPKSPKIAKVTPKNNAKINLPDPEELSPQKLYSEALAKTPKGNKYSAVYQNLVAAILSQLFIAHPDKIELEKEINKGRKRIDIVLTNNQDRGFFHTAKAVHAIVCPYVLVECKNYTDDLANAEFDQLASRFADDWGRLGILVCRQNKNRDKILDITRGIHHREPKNLVMWLEDKDLVEMLSLSSNGSDEVNDYMKGLMEEILFN